MTRKNMILHSPFLSGGVTEIQVPLLSGARIIGRLWRRSARIDGNRFIRRLVITKRSNRRVIW